MAFSEARVQGFSTGAPVSFPPSSGKLVLANGIELNAISTLSD